MVYPKQAAPSPGAVDKDKVLALHDYEGTCGLCLEPCDSTQDELNALCCTFEPCPSPSIYHQSCLEAYLKSIRLDKQRKTGFACPRNCGKAAKGEKACPGRVSKSHPIYARNDNSKKRRKAKMPEPLVIVPPVVGKKPPLPKASPREEKASAEERGRVVALVKGERASKPMPILVVNSARQQTSGVHEEARAELQLLRSRRDGGRTDEKGVPQRTEAVEPEEEYAPPRGPTSLADFTLAFTKMKGRKGATVSAPSPEAKRGTEQISEGAALQESPMDSSDAVPALPSSPPPSVVAVAAPDPPPTPPPEETPKKKPSESPRQEEAAQMRSPSKSQRKHQQRLAARHLREKHDASVRNTAEGITAVPALLLGPVAEQGGSGSTGLPSPALAHPLETVEETAAFPPLPSPKPSAARSPLRPLPPLRLVPPEPAEQKQKEPLVPPSEEGAPIVAPQPQLAQVVEAWSGACEAAVRERKVQVHATQLQGLGYFSEAQCLAAVRACGADLNRCCEWLLSGGTSDPTSTAHLDISAELSRLTDLVAIGTMTQAALESAVLRHNGDIDAALRPPSASGESLPAPPMSIVTTPLLPPNAVPTSAVSPGGGSEFGAISRPSSSSSNRSAGSPWGGLDSRGSSSEASSFFSTSAWGSLSGASLVPSPPSVNGTDTTGSFSPFGGGFPSELLRTSSWHAETATPRTTPTPPWPVPQGHATDTTNSREGSLRTKTAGDPFGSFGVRSASSVEAWSLSDLSDPDSADSAISEATQSTVTSVAAAVLQDSFDDPVPPPPMPPQPSYAQMYPPRQQPLWAGPYQEGPPQQQQQQTHRMGQHTQGQGFAGINMTMKHGNNLGGRNGSHLKMHGASEAAPGLWGFAGMPPMPAHAGFGGEAGFFEGPERGMAGGYARHTVPSNGPFVEGPQYPMSGRQPRGVLWREGGPGRAYGPEGPHHWADQDRLVTQLLSQLLV